MDKLEEKKKKLLQKMNRLKEKEAQMKIAERKKRTRRLIEFGGLVEKANLSHLAPVQLLGAFLQIKDQSENPQILASWEKIGADEFNKNKGVMDNEKPITIKFEQEPNIAVRKQLRLFGMRWNSVRKEWEGIADPNAIKQNLQNVEMTIHEILVAQ